MDIRLYQKFLEENEQARNKLAHLDPGKGFKPQGPETPLAGGDGLPLQAGADMMASAFDPTGSWTGIPQQPGEVPQQDADDL